MRAPRLGLAKSIYYCFKKKHLLFTVSRGTQVRRRTSTREDSCKSQVSSTPFFGVVFFGFIH